MWGWAQALASAAVPQAPLRLSSSDCTPADQHKTLIQFFAALAMNSSHRRER
jgi:hypothetical protein